MHDIEPTDWNEAMTTEAKGTNPTATGQRIVNALDNDEPARALALLGAARAAEPGRGDANNEEVIAGVDTTQDTAATTLMRAAGLVQVTVRTRFNATEDKHVSKPVPLAAAAPLIPPRVLEQILIHWTRLGVAAGDDQLVATALEAAGTWILMDDSGIQLPELLFPASEQAAPNEAAILDTRNAEMLATMAREKTLGRYLRSYLPAGGESPAASDPRHASWAETTSAFDELIQNGHTTKAAELAAVAAPHIEMQLVPFGDRSIWDEEPEITAGVLVKNVLKGDEGTLNLYIGEKPENRKGDPKSLPLDAAAALCTALGLNDKLVDLISDLRGWENDRERSLIDQIIGAATAWMPMPRIEPERGMGEARSLPLWVIEHHTERAHRYNRAKRAARRLHEREQHHGRYLCTTRRLERLTEDACAS